MQVIKAKRFKLRKAPNFKLHNFWHELKYKLKHFNNSCAYRFLALPASLPLLFLFPCLSSTSLLYPHEQFQEHLLFCFFLYQELSLCGLCLQSIEIPISRYTKPKRFLSFIIYQACMKLTNHVTRHRGCKSSLHHFSHSSDFTIEQTSHGKVYVISLRTLSPSMWTFY